MSYPHFEVLIGTIDGVNETFYTSMPYKAGSLAVLLNGQLKHKDRPKYGWVETSPSTGRVDLTTPPLLGDVVQAFFLDTLPAQPIEEVSTLRAVLLDTDTISVEILEQGCFGTLSSDFDIDGRMVDETILANLIDTDILVGNMYEVC